MTFSQDNVYLIIDGEELRGLIYKDPKSKEVRIAEAKVLTAPEDAVKLINKEV